MKVLWFANTPCGAAEILSPEMNLGGWLRSLEEQLVQREGIELSVCFYWKEDIPPFKHKGTSYYPVHRSIYYYIANRIFNYTEDDKNIKELLKVIGEVAPDVIHIHGTEENFGLIQAFTQVPVMISLQGILSPYAEKYFSGIPAISAFLFEGLKKKILFNSELLLAKRIKRNAVRERKILSQARNVFGRTNWDKRISGILAPNAKYFVNNEILRKSFYKNQWNKSEFSDPLQIVTIMSSGLYKGLETIIKTAGVLNEYNNLNFTWTIIGQKETDIFPKIVKRWLKADYKKLNINFVGSKNESQIVDILIKSDIYCQVSHIENSPNSVCEAMLLGMPIIASFAGGTDSMLKNQSEGILIQDGDPYSYAGTIVSLINDPANIFQFARKAQEKAHKRHDPVEIVNSLILTYNEVMDKANNLQNNF
ncbi:glycosyltransferase family 4 protein [Emticicia sp. TH156]|uniref:glycosyltransferase family 4 protein n=1 Tax=Emticicia sp. TH156 TaxID=2067454 RepID=UPI000C760906|nr:glycosyltransferase family 4 protein [Emticicia sp. TH156]PLK44032.1 hypothetical protein C0V77_12835 [Emticicia sp. TH156]